MSSNKRSKYIDIAKGIAMICIVLGHLGKPSINRIVFTFHVPIFFLITGYFLNTKKTYIDFLKNKIKTLLIPYILSCASIIFSALFMNIIFQGEVTSREIVIHWLKASLYGAGDSYDRPFIIIGIGAVWFLLATFWGSIILRGLLSLSKFLQIVIVICVFLISCWSAKIVWLPLSIQAGGCALLFMYIGYWVRTQQNVLLTMNKTYKIIWTILAFCIWGAFIATFKSFWLVHCNVGRGIVDIFASLCGCYCVMLLAKGIELYIPIASSLLAYGGRYSLIMLYAHIIELNTFPWHRISDKLQGYGMESKMVLVFVIIAKFIWIFSVTIIISKCNLLKRLFGYPTSKDIKKGKNGN